MRYFKKILNLTLLFVLVGSACKPKTIDSEEVPKNVLSEDSLINVLTYCYLGEGAASMNIKGVSAEKFDSAYAFNPIKEKGITKARFDSSIIYYSAHPKKLKLIYEKVLEQLSQIQANGKLK